jgi:hypothetical protein
MRLSRHDATDLLRSIGGVLFAAGAVLVLVRESAHHEWGAFAQLLVVLVPAVLLYVLALGAFEDTSDTPDEQAQPWQSVLMVTAILLVPVALFELLRWVGASTHHVLYGAGVFALTGLLAGYATRRARVSYAALLAGLSSLVAWLLVWEKIAGHPSANTYRWLLVAGAVLLLVVAVRLARAGAIGAGEVATAGGIAAVSAGVLGVIVGYVAALTRSITRVFEPGSIISRSRSSSSFSSFSSSSSSSSGPRISGNPRISHNLRIPRSPHISTLPIHTSGLQHFGWDLYLLVVSLALVWIGSRARVRGLGYVGGAGLLAFLISVGGQVTRLEYGRAATSQIVGWPLALLILGLVGLAAPMLSRRAS